MYLIFDTETTGIPHNKSAPIEDLDNWPRLVQLAWQLHDVAGKLLSSGNEIIKPEGFTIPFNAQKIHGISTARAEEVGEYLGDVLKNFSKDAEQARVLIGHNIEFDNKILGAEYLRSKMTNILEGIANIDTARETKEFCQLKGGLGGGLKIPRLIELYEKLFGESFEDAHDAAYDVDATAKSFFELLRKKIILPLEGVDVAQIEYEAPQLSKANFAWIREDTNVKLNNKFNAKEIEGSFCHLHVHSQFSILQATPSVEAIIEKAKFYEMPAVALTDLGNMFGAFKFVTAAHKAKIKPIVGCEVFVAAERTKIKFTRDNPDRRFQQVLLVKNKQGYENLTKLSSLGYIEGLYGLYPRVDKELIKKYSEGIIALSGGLQSEVPRLILNVGETQAEQELLWWKEVFGEDYYIEINRHDLEAEAHLNKLLIQLAKKHNIKIVAANELFYLEEKDSRTHDILICIKENEKQSTEIGRGRGFRPGLPNSKFYFKSQGEMKEAFTDLPEAINNISEIIEKVENYKLERDVLLPIYDIPSDFIDPKDGEDGGKRGENAYLEYLSYEGAKQRYNVVTDEIKERLEFELEIIKKTGYPGYFLIVQDLTSKAREMGVVVGPGRGSAAGSVVAYCIGITNVDPIAYDLLFERFLNPDRVSLPDIDIDFDNEGRERVIKYVIEKYGFNQVAQIITYGTMAPRSAIRDAGRVMELPLSETDNIAKLVPERPGANFTKVLEEVPELKKIQKGKELPSQVLNQAVILEGSLRNTGIHACGVIITPQDVTELIPVAKSKDSDLLLTQFDNSVVELAGMLKMDFLGLKTLSIIKTTTEYVEKRHDIKIDFDVLPMDDIKTYELFARGETNGTFQFESRGMQKHLRALKPDRFEDLIAMNALYRPGPMEYIPNYIARKHGKETITYDLPEMEEYLAETYGITVYQEQVMLLSQKLAGFTRGEADLLRKAMGKKIYNLLMDLKPKFIDQAREKGHSEEKLEKIWKNWEAFADYAFNKSHSTCYAVLAYQTGYLKAHYPAEFMASLLTHNLSDSDKVSFFMEECRNLNIPILGPHVNESGLNFIVNPNGEIRFGLGAIKGTGESAARAIIEERDENGPFKDIFEFASRLNLRAVNKKTFESLAKAGAFDCFEEYHRRQYLDPDDEGTTLSEKVIRYANKVQEEEASSQTSLFGNDNKGLIIKPKVGKIEPYGKIEKLKIEKEMVGLYITGHPLDQYKFEMKYLCNAKLSDLRELRKGSGMKIGGIVTEAQHRISKKGNPYGQIVLEDFDDNHTFYLFSKDYLNFKPLLEKDWFLFLTGSVQNRWDSEELEFKIHSIEHLSEIREKMTKGIELKLALNDLNKSVVDEIERIVLKHLGKSFIKLSILDTHENKTVQIDMLSRKFSVEVSDSLMKELNNLEELDVGVIV